MDDAATTSTTPDAHHVEQQSGRKLNKKNKAKVGFGGDMKICVLFILQWGHDGFTTQLCVHEKREKHAMD